MSEEIIYVVATTNINTEQNNAIKSKRERNYMQCAHCRRDHKRCDLESEESQKCIRCAVRGFPCGPRTRKPIAPRSEDIKTLKFMLSLARESCLIAEPLSSPCGQAGHGCKGTNYRSFHLEAAIEHLAVDSIQKCLFFARAADILDGIDITSVLERQKAPHRTRRTSKEATSNSDAITWSIPTEPSEVQAVPLPQQTSLKNADAFTAYGDTELRLSQILSTYLSKLKSRSSTNLDLENGFPASHIAYAYNERWTALHIWKAVPEKTDILRRPLEMIAAENDDLELLQCMQRARPDRFSTHIQDNRRFSSLAIAICRGSGKCLDFLLEAQGPRFDPPFHAGSINWEVIDISLAVGVDLITRKLVTRGYCKRPYQFIQKAIKLGKADLATLVVDQLYEDSTIQQENINRLASLAQRKAQKLMTCSEQCYMHGRLSFEENEDLKARAKSMWILSHRLGESNWRGSHVHFALQDLRAIGNELQ